MQDRCRAQAGPGTALLVSASSPGSCAACRSRTRWP